ncbi:stage VI sporulation protein D [Amphibacillus sp. Q70]|uniref:stage VI sporulation protein D n=1 Tax=Amphibacillus sp. Q70 TaxID=3453416 RepID=UPI003F83F18F
MTDKEVKPFQFDLTETLFFHRNEGVSEMLGIGLDPEISIESRPDHVVVRGIIALTGEYLPVFVDDQSEVEDYEDVQSRYFKRVERDEEGICEFLHHFPIDISIPHERVKNLEDLTVSIDHFDYYIPDARKLELEATVQIDGLEYNNESETETDIVDTPIEPEVETDSELELVEDQRIHFDVKVKEEETELINEKEDIETKPDIVEEKVIPFKQREEPELIEEALDQVEIREEVEEFEEVEKENITINEAKASQEEERVQQPTYLLGLFDQDTDEDERYSQLKMYIVQEEDSLEQIAEKYQISLAKLQRANQLEVTSVHQGQIIYLPQ